MNLYWLYDLPNPVFGLIVVAFFVAFGLVGLYATRRVVRRLHNVDHSHNDIVGFYLAGITVFYGITLGLLAVGTWTSYEDAQTRVDLEATAIGSLYRSVGSYPEPQRSILQKDLKTYTYMVVHTDWPQQQRGKIPLGGSVLLASFQKHFLEFEPMTESQKTIHAEAYTQFNTLVERRRGRLNSVTSELPGPLWGMMMIGGFICIAVTWFFHTASFPMHVWMTILFSGLLGLLIFLVAALDNPYRGGVSVTPDALQMVYDQLMTNDSSQPHDRPDMVEVH